ncbi:MAG: NAD(P)-dependent oxidoreductase [Pseudolabrys sp.]|nr:NAD(P)-dependent oxidoreductase [Pseudolabrys sp.]
MSRSTVKIAFLGTGLMGAPMARRLLQSGHAVTAWNRTKAKAEALAADGAAIADTPAEAVRNAELVIAILENAPVVESVFFAQGAAAAAPKGTCFIDMSSIAPHFARSHSERLAAMGHRHIDAPVSGGPEGAALGTLAIMAGATEADFEQAKPVLSVMGRPTRVGDSGAGQFAKLTSQMIASTAMTAVAEALLLARAEGIDPLRVREALRGGFADSRILQIHGQRMVERDFIPGGHVHTFVKDLKAGRQIADSHNLDLPVTALAFELFEQLSHDAGACDISAMALQIEKRNAPTRIGAGNDRLPAPDG